MSRVFVGRLFVGRLFFAAAAGCIALAGCGGKAVVDAGAGGAASTAQTSSSAANSSSAAGTSCDQIAAAYRAAIAQDSTCCVQCNKPQCKNQARIDLASCCQLVWVDKTDTLAALQAQYQMQGCDKCRAVNCPAMPPTIGECVPAGMGKCQTVPAGG